MLRRPSQRSAALPLATGVPGAYLVARSGIALAVTMVLLSVATGAGASPPPAASRVKLATSPPSSPPIRTLNRVNDPDQAKRTATIKQLIAQRMTELSRLRPRSFKAPRATPIAAPHREVLVSGRAGAAFNHPENYCAQHPPEIDSVSGDITPHGELTIRGDCFGTSGNVHLTGNFPVEANGIDLLIESWSDSVVKAKLLGNLYATVDSFSGSLDQPVELRLVTRRVAGGMSVVGSGVVSTPVRLDYRAERITTRVYVDVLTCASGETLDWPDACGVSGWLDGTSYGASHVRKASAARGEDIYSVRLKHGYVFDGVTVNGDWADVSIDPSLDPSNVTFRIRWRAVESANLDRARHGFPDYADYGDGSYTFFATATGPKGALP
ncbi:MAG: hypothetical protein NVS3B28_29220 [Candidatus Velthaea sp.]